MAASRVTTAIAVSQERQGGPPRKPIAPSASRIVRPPRYNEGTQAFARPYVGGTAVSQCRFPSKCVPKTLGQTNSARRAGSRLNG